MTALNLPVAKNLSEIQAQWVTVRGRIRQKIGDAQFASWIKMLTLEDYEDRKVILSAPSNFIRTRIIEQYLDIIKSYWLVQNLKINDIQIIVSKKKNNNQVITTKESVKLKEQNSQGPDNRADARRLMSAASYASVGVETNSNSWSSSGGGAIGVESM